MDPQEALDAPRFCIGTGYSSGGLVTSFEEGISLGTISKLKSMGHGVEGPVKGHDRSLFGRGQIICSRPMKTKGKDLDGSVERVNVWWAGSDGRSDGMVLGY